MITNLWGLQGSRESYLVAFCEVVVMRSKQRICDNCQFSTNGNTPADVVRLCKRMKDTADGSAGGVCNQRLIPLTRGKFAVVDIKDYPRLVQYRWYAERSGHTFYAVRRRNGVAVKMHHHLMRTPKHLTVGHFDHDGLNNTRKNLRLRAAEEFKKPKRDLSSLGLE